MRQFNRTATLKMGDEVLNLRLQFSIRQEMYAAGGGSEIKIFNLSPKHLSEIEVGKNRQSLTLAVGYGGENKLLYTGPIFYSRSDQMGPDTVTTCQMMPGTFAYGTVFVNLSGISNDYQILQAVLSAFKPFGVVKGTMSGAVIAKLQGGTYARGFSEIGTASKLLDMITRRHGLRWNTQNNELNLYAVNEYEDTEMILLNAQTGMLGIPSKTMEGNYMVHALLNPELTPGKRIRVESLIRPMKGDLKIFRATHVGDTYEGTWQTEIEGYLLGTAPGFSAGN